MKGSIVTKYIGATNTKPGRIKAVSSSGTTITVSWDHDLDCSANHWKAAEALATKISEDHEYGWTYRVTEGLLLADCVGWAYAFVLEGEPK